MASESSDNRAEKSMAMQAAEDLHKTAREKAAQLKASAETRVQQIREMAEDQAQQLTGQVENPSDPLSETAEDSWEDVKVRTKELQVELERYVRQYPTKSVIISVGVGMVLGMLFRR